LNASQQETIRASSVVQERRELAVAPLARGKLEPVDNQSASSTTSISIPVYLDPWKCFLK
jgi:hypothetical protein